MSGAIGIKMVSQSCKVRKKDVVVVKIRKNQKMIIKSHSKITSKAKEEIGMTNRESPVLNIYTLSGHEQTRLIMCSYDHRRKHMAKNCQSIMFIIQQKR